MSRTNGDYHGWINVASWWGKRPLAWYEPSLKSGKNKFFKRLLHKIERQKWKKEIVNNLDENDAKQMWL